MAERSPTAEDILTGLANSAEDGNFGFETENSKKDAININPHDKLYSDVSKIKRSIYLYQKKNITLHEKTKEQLLQMNDLMKKRQTLDDLALNRPKINPDFNEVLKYKGEKGDLFALYRYSNAKQKEEENIYNTHF